MRTNMVLEELDNMNQSQIVQKKMPFNRANIKS